MIAMRRKSVNIIAKTVSSLLSILFYEWVK